MTKHKLFKELFELPPDETYEINALIDLVREARMDFERVGVEFTYEGFKEYARRVYAPQISSGPGHYAETYKKQLQIIEGDNLDIIEDAAEKKGLL